MGVELGFQLFVLGHGNQLGHLPVILHLGFQAGDCLIIRIRDDTELILAVNADGGLQVAGPGILHHIQYTVKVLCLFFRHLPGPQQHPQGHEDQRRYDQGAA